MYHVLLVNTADASVKNISTWTNLARALHEAGQHAERIGLVSDPDTRWSRTKLTIPLAPIGLPNGSEALVKPAQYARHMRSAKPQLLAVVKVGN